MGWQEFYETFGGNVFLCHQAVDKLRQQFELGQERLFDPFKVRGNAGLGDLVRDPLTRKHMENLAQKGWSPIEDGAAEEETESQKGARIIAKKNFGAIIESQTATFFDEALKEDMFRDPDTVQVLIPPTTYARKCIQRMVDTWNQATWTSKKDFSFGATSRHYEPQSFCCLFLNLSGAFIGYANHFFSIRSRLNMLNARHHQTTSWSSVGEATKGGQEWPVPVSCFTKEALLYWVLR